MSDTHLASCVALLNSAAGGTLLRRTVRLAHLRNVQLSEGRHSH